jgi:hypothetical protein
MKRNELADYYAEAARKLQLAADSLKRSAATMRKCGKEMESKSK